MPSVEHGVGELDRSRYESIPDVWTFAAYSGSEVDDFSDINDSFITEGESELPSFWQCRPRRAW